MSKPRPTLTKNDQKWWRLYRLVPRFWMPRPLRWTEAAYVGGLFGLCFVILAWIALRYWEEPLWQNYPDWMEPSTIALILWGLFALPSLISVLLWRAGLMQPRDAARLGQSGTGRAVECAIFLLREKHILKYIDYVAATLLIIAGGHIAWQIFRMGRSISEWLPEAHLAGTTLVLIFLGTTLRHNRFHPRARRFEIPTWFTTLTEELRHDENKRIASTNWRNPDYEVVWPDDLPSFIYRFSDDLPEPIQQIAVHVGPEVNREMAKHLARSGGSLFRRRNFTAARDMINPFEGPLATIGLLEYQRLVAQIITRARVAKWDRATLASRILAFVQREIIYVDDETSTGYPEYGRFPLQTLVDGKGDCDCKAILCCALLSYCGFDAAFIVTEGHALCGLRRPTGWLSWLHIFLPKRHAADYLIGETTDSDGGGEWQPPSAAQLAQVKKVVPVAAMDLASDG